MGILPTIASTDPSVLYSLRTLTTSTGQLPYGRRQFIIRIPPGTTPVGCTTTTANATYSVVQAAVTAAANGDVVCVPANSSDTWSSQLAITKGITLRGAGCTLSTQHSIGNIPTPTCSTTINANTGSTKAISITLVAGYTTRLTGFKFTSGTLDYLIDAVGCSNDSRRIRIDHNYFSTGGTTFADLDTTLGVIDHNNIVQVASGHQVFGGFTRARFWGSNCGGSNHWGDDAYADDDNFGTDKFTFYEDNVIDGCPYTANDVTGFDGLSGARAVFRYNWIGCTSLEAHGLEDTRDRSWRAVEIYNNTFAGSGVRDQPVYYRGGTGVIHDNTISGWLTSAKFALLNNRSLNPNASPFGGDSGASAWDINNGSFSPITGTATAGTGSLSLVDSGKSWTTNQYADYTVRITGGTGSVAIASGGCTRSSLTVTCNTSAAHGFSTGDIVGIFGANEYAYQGTNQFGPITVVDSDTFTFDDQLFALPTATGGSIRTVKGANFGIINSNTSTTLTIQASIFEGLGVKYDFQPVSGATYEIDRVDQAFDQPGRCKGTNLAGAAYPTLPGSNDQVTCAWYEWNNTREGGANVDFAHGRTGGTYPTIVDGTHYHNDTTPGGHTPYTYPHPLTSTP